MLAGAAPNLEDAAAVRVVDQRCQDVADGPDIAVRRGRVQLALIDLGDRRHVKRLELRFGAEQVAEQLHGGW